MEIVVFRDNGPRGSSAFDPHCAHRGHLIGMGYRSRMRAASAAWHAINGWLYDTQGGQCIDMPCETAEIPPAPVDVWQPAYPTHEYGGLWSLRLYGPRRAPSPLFPRVRHPFDTRRSRDYVEIARHAPVLGRLRRRHMCKDCILACSIAENIVDPWHLVMHVPAPDDQRATSSRGALIQGEERRGSAWGKTPLSGVRYNLIKDLPSGNPP